MAIVEHTYYQRAKCNGCNDILWTTDTTGGVLCPCMATEITPTEITSAMGVGYTEPTNTEHRQAVKENYGLEEDDTVYLIEGKKYGK